MISADADDIRLRRIGNGYYITSLLRYIIPSYSVVYHTAKPYIIDNTSQFLYNEYSWKEVVIVSENKLLKLSFEFAAAVVNLADSIRTPKSSYMIDQFARAGTSVGANIHEAQYAHSKADFIIKLEIALKEANETSYWLKLLHETKRIDDSGFNAAEKLCGNIRRLLIASCQTAKENNKR